MKNASCRKNASCGKYSILDVGWVDVVDVRELVLFSDARRC